MKNFKLNAKILAARSIITFIILSLPTTLTGCSKKAECDVDETHAHIYTDDQGFIKYLESEKLTSDNFVRGNQYITLSDTDSSLLEFATKKNLLPIKENLDLLTSLFNQYETHLEYEYEYEDFYYDIIFEMPMWDTEYDWTTDPNHQDLTGEVEEVSYMFQAYKIAKDDKGKYVLIPSEYVTDIASIMDEYPYYNKNSIVEIRVSLENNKELIKE